MTDQPTDPFTVGWREWIMLPDLGIAWTKAKIDTGARSSSLHAHDLERFTIDDTPWVRFSIHPWQASDLDPVVVECPVADERLVRSSSGDEQERPVIRTKITLGSIEREIDVTLTRRDSMGFRMLLGREALRDGIVVDAQQSYCAGRPPPSIRRRNRATP